MFSIQRNRKLLKAAAAVLSALCIMAVSILAGPAVTALADENITVDGTVTDKTSDTILYLSTSGGTMAIKIDGSTDLTGCKLLYPDKKVKVTCARQNDGYLHASRIAAIQQSSGGSASNVPGAVSVSGTIKTGTSDSILFLDTSGGTMQLKIDSSTNMDSCRALTVGKKITVSTVRGSDAYMHALVITDSQNSSSGSSSSGSSSSASTQISGISVQGTVASGTTGDMLLLNTSGGQMKLKIDGSTDLSACKVLIPGRTVTSGWVRGDDAYLHSTKIVGASTSYNNANVNTGSAVSVSGKVSGNTTENMLYLDTSGGKMAIKIDNSTAMGCRVLYENQSVTVSVARGDDAYMHAVRIDGQGGSSSSSSSSSQTVTPTSETIMIQGTVKSGTTENELQLGTSGGDMKIKIDANTNLSVCKTLIPNDTVAVACYRGSDAYFHASVITGTVQPGSGSVDGSSAVTVTGKVASGTKGNLLYLVTDGGTMQIKLDTGTSMNGVRVLTQDRSVKVSVARGSDAYMHAVSISAN